MTHYEVLGLDGDTQWSTEDIKRAYRERLLQHHPDKVDGGDKGSFLTVQRAWEVLRDGRSRSMYDAELGRQRLLKVHVSEKVEADQMAWDETTGALSKPCRCGGEFILSQEDAENGLSIVQCTNCSFHVEVMI